MEGKYKISSAGDRETFSLEERFKRVGGSSHNPRSSRRRESFHQFRDRSTSQVRDRSISRVRDRSSSRERVSSSSGGRGDRGSSSNRGRGSSRHGRGSESSSSRGRGTWKGKWSWKRTGKVWEWKTDMDLSTVLPQPSFAGNLPGPKNNAIGI